MRITSLLVVVGCAALGCAALGCADDAGQTGTGGGGGAGQGGAGGIAVEPTVTVLTPNAPPLPGQTECRVTITENLPNTGQAHVPVCTEVSYATNPPASGNHWPIWAAFGSYTTPVPRPMLVHDLEHGAVVMSYRCAPDCPDVTDAFAQAIADHGVDPVCAAGIDPSIVSRFVVTPDPLLDVPLALSTWRATYVATCIDAPSIASFIAAHYAKGPENFCSQGKDPADPLTGVPACGL